MRSNSSLWMAIIMVLLIAGAIIIWKLGSQTTPVRRTISSAPGSLQPGEAVSPHFVASIDRPAHNTFRVAVMPTPTNKNVCLDSGSTMIRLLVLDQKGNKVAGTMPLTRPENPNLPQFAVERIGVEDGPPGPNGTVRWERRTFIVRTHKLPKGKYTVSARVEVAEEGPGAVQGLCFNGAIAARVTNYFTLVVN